MSNVENGRLVLRRYGGRTFTIPLKMAIQIKRRMEAGMPYWQASLVIWLDREAAAVILATPWKELACAYLNTRR